MASAAGAANFYAAGRFAAASPSPSFMQSKKRVVFVGKSGVGKDALASLILGRPAFKTSGELRGTTRRSEVAENDNYLFVDTHSRGIIQSKIVDGLKILGKFDAIFLVVEFGGHEQALDEAHTFLTKCSLGEEMYENMIVVFTCSPWNYVLDPIDAHNYITEQCLSHPQFRELYGKICGRVLFVSNPGVSRDSKEEAVYKRHRALSLEHVTEALSQMNSPPIVVREENFLRSQEMYQDMSRSMRRVNTPFHRPALPASPARMKKRVAFVGKTGSGKSALASLILGRPAFAVSGGMQSKTKRSQIEENDKYLFVDTQGLLDTDDSQMVVRSNIVDGLKLLGKVDIILLVVNIGRYDKALHEAHTFLVEAVLGEEAYNNMIIVFTFCRSTYVRDEREAQRYLTEECLTHAHFRELYFKINGRVLFVSNPPVSDDPDEEVNLAKQRALSLEHVTMAIDQMNAPPIMNEDFRRTQNKFDGEMKRHAEEERRLKAERELAIMTKGRAAAEKEFAAKFEALQEQRAASEKKLSDEIAQLNQRIAQLGNRGGGEKRRRCVIS